MSIAAALRGQNRIYIRALSTPEGRELLKDLYKQYGKRLSFDDSSDRKTAFNEGQRSVYLRMIRLAGINPRDLEEEAENERD